MTSISNQAGKVNLMFTLIIIMISAVMFALKSPKPAQPVQPNAIVILHKISLDDLIDYNLQAGQLVIGWELKAG